MASGRGDTGSAGRADFEECYAAHFHSLTLQLNAYLGNLTEAQDMVQEAFCRALARWDRIAGYHDPAAWVRRVAWNGNHETTYTDENRFKGVFQWRGYRWNGTKFAQSSGPTAFA